MTFRHLDMPYGRPYKRRRTTYARTFRRRPYRSFRRRPSRFSYRRSGKILHHPSQYDLSMDPISKQTAHKPDHLNVSRSRHIARSQKPLKWSVLPGPDPSIPIGQGALTWDNVLNTTASMMDAYTDAAVKTVNTGVWIAKAGGTLALANKGFQMALGDPHSAEKPNPMRGLYDLSVDAMKQAPSAIIKAAYKKAKRTGELLGNMPLMIAPPGAIAADQMGYFDNIKATWQALPSVEDLKTYATMATAPLLQGTLQKYMDYQAMNQGMAYGHHRPPI